MTITSNPPRDFSQRRTIPIALPSRATIALLLILILAGVLRFHRLDEGPWLDEILTDVLFVRMPYQQIVSTYDSENQHFLYTILARVSYDLFGPSVWALRLPAVVFGLGSLLALYIFARRVTSTREALLATAFLAFSYHHVWFSQNARGYTALLFWTLVSSTLFLSAQRPVHWLAYGAAAALGMYTHLTMVFVLVGHGLLYACELWQSRRSLTTRSTYPLIGFVSAGILTLALYSPVLTQMLRTVTAEGAGAVTEWQNPLWTALETWRGLSLGLFGQLAVLSAALFFGAGLLSYLKTRFAVVLLLVVPALVGGATVIAMHHHLWPRFFFFAAGFGVLVLIRGIVVLARAAAGLVRWPRERQDWFGITLCIILIALSAASVSRAYGPKQDFKGALTFVEGARKSGDAVVTIGLTVLPYQLYYTTDWVPVASLDELDAIRARATRTWLVYTLEPQLWDTVPEVMRDVQAEFRTVRRFPGTLGGGEVVVASTGKKE